MQLIVVNNYEELSKVSARYVFDLIQNKEKLNLGLATGDTPLGMYEELVYLNYQQPQALSEVITFNLDEYVGLSPDSPRSYRYYMNKHLFSPLGIDLEQTHIPVGNSIDLKQECQRYERLLSDHGGIDIQILGVGRNGHIGFNEPGTSFDQETHVISLSESTREANEKHFNSLKEVPNQAITMGISTIMKAKKIVLLANGQEKAEAIYQLVQEDEVTNKWPVTILKKHPDVTVIMDYAAASLLPQEAEAGK